MKTPLERFIPIFVRFLPVFERFMPILTRLITILDRFVPVFASYFLVRMLRAWKSEGLIDDFETRITRAARLHYDIDIYIVLTPKQAKIFLNDLLTKVLRRLKK